MRRPFRSPGDIAGELECEWQSLCKRHLPFQLKGSLWRASRAPTSADPAQGWKLHLAATILSACEVFRRVAPRLHRDGLLFKAPVSLRELQKLNAGVDYGFGQAGKFLTIFPPSDEAAVALARELDRLTAGLPAPLIAYDEVLRPGSCVYYRYGSFRPGPADHLPNPPEPLIVGPNGRLIPDRREPGFAAPRWLPNPFRQLSPAARVISTPLETRFDRFEAVVQRGRGGVYRAFDRTVTPPVLRVLKEGRRHGETDWRGRDGIDRVQREARFLREVSPRVGGVPRFLATFRAHGSLYLVMEHLPGRTLHAVITGRQTVSARRILTYALGMARIVADIHAAGWCWLDCKPANFLCGKNHQLRAVDFESACRIDQPEFPELETPGYRPTGGSHAASPADDLFALGISIAQLVTRQANPPAPAAVFKTRAPWDRLPPLLSSLTRALLHPDPAQRPAARAVQKILETERVTAARPRRSSRLKPAGRP